MRVYSFPNGFMDSAEYMYKWLRHYGMTPSWGKAAPGELAIDLPDNEVEGLVMMQKHNPARFGNPQKYPLKASVRMAGFEKHLDEKMDSLGYKQSDYEVEMSSGRPVVTMARPTSDVQLRDLASRLSPDFNAVVNRGRMVFMPTRQFSTVGVDRTAADGMEKQVNELASALDEVNEAILEAEKKVKEAEGIARAMGGEVSRVVGGQLELYTGRTLAAFRNNGHQLGSVTSLTDFLDGWYQEQKEQEQEEG